MSEIGIPRRSLHEVLDALVRLVKRQRVPYMLMGGFALSVWGRVRVTQDVDVGLSLDPRDEATFLAGLQRAHFLSTTPQPILGHRLIVCRYLNTSRGFPVEVDLFLARGEYQRQALQRAVTVAVGRRRIRVIAPEDLILYKLLADRPIDRLDIQTILEEQVGRLDRRYLTRWAAGLGVAKRLRAIRARS